MIQNKFTVIVALYNREQYIRQALSSVLKQSFNDYEVVIIDDASTDNSMSIVRELANEKCRIFEKTHSGCWDTKNYAIRMSQGEYLLFVDSDDFISRDYLLTASQLIQENPTYDYYYPTRLEIVNENGKSLNKIWRYLDYSEDTKKDILRLFIQTTIGAIPHAGALIRRDMFEKNGFFNADLYNFGDTDYIIRNLFKIRFKMIDNLLYYYNRNHSEKLCTNMKHRTKAIASLLDYIFKNYHPSLYFVPDYSGSIKDKSEFYQFCIKTFLKLSEELPDYQEVFGTYARNFLLKLRELQVIF